MTNPEEDHSLSDSDEVFSEEPEAAVEVVTTVSCNTQTDPDEKLEALLQLRGNILLLKKELEVLQSIPQRFDIKYLKAEQIVGYTGVRSTIFPILLQWLAPAIKSINQNTPSTSPVIQEHMMYGRPQLTDSQKLLMVLVRMRLSLTQEDLAYRFCVEQSTVSRILSHWIPMLASNLRELISWPKTNIGPQTPPYDHLPNSVGIIDGTEIFIQRPSVLGTQKSSYSDYKSHNTVKYIVRIDTFTGAFTYVSPGYSGNSSDRFIVNNSGFLDYLKPGQRILADCGLLSKKRVF